jgi:hypothetical protein
MAGRSPCKFTIRVRAQMRAKLAHSAILATTILTVAGCKSGGGPRWNWWSSKDKSSADALVNAPAGPQLPSAAVTAGNPGTPSLNAGTATTQAGLTGGMAPAYNASSYAEHPAAATSYGAGAYPATQTAEYTNPYATTASATPATGAMPSSAVQQGPYSQTYPQQGAQTNPYADNRQMPAQDAAHGNYGSTPSYGGADPNYRGSDPGYRTADVRSTPAYDTRPAESPRYDVTTEMSSPDYTRPSYGSETQPPATGSSSAGGRYGESYQPGTSDYKPGASDYTPGNTGYNGTRSYEGNQPSAGGAAPSGERKDPGYRPAGTSDYPASGRVGGSAGAGFSTPMSSAPAKAGVVPAGYQQPASGEQDATTPARFQPQENATDSTLNFGRRSYE